MTSARSATLEDATSGWRRLALRVAPFALPVIFALTSGRHLLALLVGPGAFGYDARVYALAANAWLTGGDPWTVDLGGARFAGPPPLLVPYAPFAFAPPELTAAFWIVADVVAVIVVLNRLRLPGWWLGFPPIFGAITMGNPEPFVLAGLVLGGAWCAPLAKPYALLPLVADRRWRTIGLCAVAGLVSLPLLPWGRFISDVPIIMASIEVQARNTSAWGDPLLMAVGAVSLIIIGRRRGLWLATPVLWPHAQMHYAAMTVPVLPAITAACWAFPEPRFTVLGVFLAATVLRVPELRTSYGNLLLQPRRLVVPAMAYVIAGASDRRHHPEVEVRLN